MPKASSIVVRIALLILLSAFAACKSAVRPASAPLPPPLPASAPADGPHADTTSAVLAGGWIDVSLSVPRTGAGPFPVVISPIVAEETLLDRGFAVARFHTNWESLRGLPSPATAPPAPATAGATSAAPPDDGTKTVGKWMLTAPRPGIVGRAYFDVITTEAEKSLPQVVDWLTTRPEIDPDRIAITGSSTSGFVALQAMAADPRIAAGVVRVACGDYFAFLRHSRLGFADDPRWVGEDGTLPLDPKYADELRAIQPIDRASRFPPRPLLMLAGSDDTAIPIDCVRRTARRFESAYAADHVPDRFRLVEFQGEGHNLGSESAKETLAWLDRWIATPVAR